MFTVIIPMRNEEQFVARCLDSVLVQLEGLPECEILCIDGASTDRTREIVREYAARDTRVRLLENPKKIAASAMNTGIRHASGDVIIRLDCHAAYHPGYFKSCLELLARSGADAVGGYIDTVPAADTPKGRAIAAATSHRFGVGGSVFRTGGGEMEVDTVPFGCFPRSLFDRLGIYDERLVRNEDLELSHRIRKTGGRIIISPAIKLTYYMRSTFSGLRRQAFNNGLWNPYLLYLLGSGLSVRHVVPLFFILSLAMLGAGGILFTQLWYILAAELLIYASAAAAVAVKLAPGARTSALLIILSFVQLHLSYGTGSAWGVVSAPFKFGLRRRVRILTDSGAGSRSDLYRIIKRICDITCSATGIVLSSPVVGLALLAVWMQDRRTPIYLAQRTGKSGKPFRMYKIRSMRVDADAANVWATSSRDSRITPVGAVIRACKLDEIPQLWNVLKGDMSLVGPRPLAPSETAVYTDVEQGILKASPGVTDIASIVFADEGSLLEGGADPDASYDRLIRPWKSRLALLYVHNQAVTLDALLVIITIIAVIYRPLALRLLGRVMESIKADDMLVMVATGKASVEPLPPPGEEIPQAATRAA